MIAADIGPTLRRVSALRVLCLRLPHVPTEVEARRLERFGRLSAAPTLATETDVDALVAGWRQWWREGRASDIGAMASALPAGLVDSDRWLATYATAAELSQIQQRVEVLRRAYHAFNRRDIEAVLSWLAPDVQWPNMLEMTTLHGHEAVRRYWEGQFRQIDPYVEPGDIVPDGDDLVADVHQVVRDLQGRVVRDERVAHRYTFRGRLIARMQVCPTTESAGS